MPGGTNVHGAREISVLKPEGIIKERNRVRAAISEAKAKVEDAIDSELWSYTMEYHLGKLDVAKNILQEVERDTGAGVPNRAEPKPLLPVTPAQIIEAVASYYGLTIAALTGRDRHERWVLARQVAMYLIRQETELTLAQIGKETGGRTPATVHHAYGKIASGLNHNDMLKAGIRTIQKNILEKEIRSVERA